MKARLIPLIAACLAELLAPAAVADVLLAPTRGTGSPDATTGGFVATGIPNVREQQVFSASDFQSVGPMIQISELAFARALGSQPIDLNLANISIHFSTTLRSPNGLSRTFSDNVGADDAIVFLGQVHFFEAGAGTYNIRVPLQTPFTYNPSRGNLLLDVFNYQPAPPPSQGVYGLTSWRGSPNGSQVEGFVDSATGGLNNNALITEFTYTPIPEPSTRLLLILAGAASAGRVVRKRIRARREKERCF